MMQRTPMFRPATIDDANVFAELINYAGEGMPLYLWSQMAEPGEDAWDVGRRRAAREEGSFSYRNATIIEHDGQCAGCPIGYEIPDNPEAIPSDMPAMFVPLQELENLAPGTWSAPGSEIVAARLARLCAPSLQPKPGVSRTSKSEE